MSSNWAGNIVFGAEHVVTPSSLDVFAEAVATSAAAGRHVSVLGTAHSFSAIADTDGTLIRTERLRRIGPLDEDARTVVVEAGVRFAELGAWLHERGWALHNLPSLPHITVAGAVATATHGSGIGNQNLAAAVEALDLVRPDGSRVHIGRDDPRFAAAVVGVGAFGAVARLVLRVRPSYDVAQQVWTSVPWADAIDRLDELLGAAYSVSLFTRWHDQIEQVWVKTRVGDVPSIAPGEFGGSRADAPVHPVDGDPAACTEQLGRPGPWHQRLTHFRPEFTPSAGAELQSEYFVDLADAAAAVEAVRSVAALLDPVLLVSEIRTVASDDVWLSPAYERETLGLHFTWRLDVDAVTAILPELERALAPLGPLPHWGKLSTIDPTTIAARIPRFADAELVRRDLDPDSVFGGAVA